MANDDQAAAERAAGAAAERERISTILGLEEAKGREKAALALAMTDVTAEQAKAILAAAPLGTAATTRGMRTCDAPGGLLMDVAAAGPAAPQ